MSINKDTIALVEAKFQNLREKYEHDLGTLVGIATNMDDKDRRTQLFADWGGVNGHWRRGPTPLETALSLVNQIAIGATKKLVASSYPHVTSEENPSDATQQTKRRTPMREVNLFLVSRRDQTNVEK